MTRALLTTKLFKPTLRPEFVPRQHLMEKLESGLRGKLILLSAPAGYGKTTLLGQWIDQQSLPFGWVSLDAEDNDLNIFFSYLIAGLQSADLEITEDILSNLQNQQEKDINSFLFHLINLVSTAPGQFSLVLDDYHRINNPQIHKALTYFLENLPPNLHIVIATRSDPPLRLAKIRAQGELCEIRVDDLRFTVQEAVQYFNRSMGLGMSPEDISILTTKTEGWIVGLQLAGISLKTHPDKHKFVITFAGDDRYIADYLLDEALDRQPKHIQSFLLQTSILDRLSAPLCNAVASRNNSQVVLAELEQANLFLVPLDHQRNWYRYHHMFAELLQNRLKHSKPGEVLELHKKASIWYGENKLLADALNHALAANDVERIVQLTEEMAVYKMDAGELNTLMAWLDGQPESILLEYPWLLVARAWVLLNTGKYNLVETSIAEIDEYLFSQKYPAGLVNRIQGHIAAIQSYMAEMQEDADTAVRQAEDALNLLTEKDVQLRAFVAIRWANCLSWIGELNKAIHALREAGNAAKAVGDGQLVVTACSERAVLQFATGRLKQSVESFEEIKNYAEMLAQKDGRRLPAMGMLYRQMAVVRLEQNQLSEARYYAREAVHIIRQWGEKDSLMHSLLGLARVAFAHGDFDKVEQLVNQAVQIGGQISPQSKEFVTVYKHKFLVMQKRLKEIESWSQDHNLTVDDEITYERRIEYQNFARLLHAKGDYAQALKVVIKLLRVAADVGAKYHVLRYYLLQANIYHSMNQAEDAMRALEEALEIASPEGYIRSFLDEGDTVAHLLYQAAQRGIYPEYCQHLLDEFSKEITLSDDTKGRGSDLVETLTDRELEVLEQIAQGCTNQEIARELFLSLHTVKSHARNIFSKLGVRNRTEAVAKARLVGLLPQD